jgi:protein TonB
MKIVWLSGTLLQKLKTNEVFPVYPRRAQAARIQGAVELFVIIGKDGTIRQLQVVSGHPYLRDAAVAAAKQWRYRPYILNGERVPVQSLITINFTMSGG